MPNPSELERQRQEAMQDEGDLHDAATVLDGLQARAKRLGFDSVTEALDAIENVGLADV